MKAIKKLNSNVFFPERLSDLIDLSLDCLMKCHNDPKYSICPGMWHQVAKGHCYVDLCGALLAKHANIPSDVSFGIMDVPLGWGSLNAISSLCDGDIEECFDIMEIGGEHISAVKAILSDKRFVFKPTLDNAEWIHGLRHFANCLRNLGL